MDTGPVLGTLTETVRPRDTSADLLDRLAVAGADLLVATLDGLEAGRLDPVPQRPDGVSVAPKLEVDDARVDLDRSRARGRPPGAGLHAGARGVDDLPRRAGEAPAARARPRRPAGGAGGPRARRDRRRAPGGARRHRVGAACGSDRCRRPARRRWRRPTGPAACVPSRGRGSRDRSPARAEGAASRPGRLRGRGSGRRSAPSQRSRAADPARDVAFEVLRAVREDDAYANLVLPVLLRRRGVDARDAGLATELTYGTLRGQGLLRRRGGPLHRPPARADRPRRPRRAAARGAPAARHPGAGPRRRVADRRTGARPDRFGPRRFRERRAAAHRRAHARGVARGGGAAARGRPRGAPRRCATATRPGWCVRCASRSWRTGARSRRSTTCSLPTTCRRRSRCSPVPGSSRWPSWWRPPTVRRPGGGRRTRWCSAAATPAG